MNSPTRIPPPPALDPTSAVAAPAELLTAQQLASRLGISRRSLSNWTRDNIVPMFKIGKICRFDYAKVRAALAPYERTAAVADRRQPTPTEDQV